MKQGSSNSSDIIDRNQDAVQEIEDQLFKDAAMGSQLMKDYQFDNREEDE